MTVFRNRGRWDRSNAVLRDGRVHYDKRHPSTLGDSVEWIDYGLTVIERSVISDALQPGESGDLADLLTDISARGNLAGFEATERFFEIGSPRGLHDLEERLRRSS